MASLRRWVLRLALLLGGLIGGVVLAELGARAYTGVDGTWLLVNGPNWYDTRIFRQDRELRQVLDPGSEGHMRTPEFDTVVRISDIGTRGANPGPKAEGTLRILALGDSFTLAVQVDEADTFCARVAHNLAATLGRPVECVNAGVDGYGTYQSTRLARRLAPGLAPDLMLLTLFTGNDLVDNAEFKPGTYSVTPEPMPPLPAIDRALSWSAIWFHHRARERAKNLARDPMAGGRLRQESEPFLRGADVRRKMGPTVSALTEFHAFAAEIGAKAAVAVAPPAYAISPERAKATFALFGIQGEPDVDALPRAILASMPPGLPATDLAPALREAEPGGRTYFIFDGHWTERGHAVVADEISSFLVESGVVP